MEVRLLSEGPPPYVFDTGPLRHFALQGWLGVLKFRRIAESEGIEKIGTLGLLSQAVRDGQLTVAMVEELADDLLSGTYYFPFKKGEYRRWAEGQGLIDPSVR